MLTSSIPKYLVVAIILLALLSACNLPLPSTTVADTPTPAPAQATLKGADATPTAPLPPTKTSLPPTTYPLPTETPPPTPAPSRSTPSGSATAAPSTAALSGFAVFDEAKSEVTGVDFATGTELFKYSVPGAGWLGQGTGQVVGTTVYYRSQNDQMVHKVNKAGTEKLNFLPRDPTLSFLVSPDGKQVAWAVDSWKANSPASELWLAAIDGSGSRKIAVIDPAKNDKYMVLKPYRWQPDGRLVFIYSPTGIGGYILFGGFGGASVYDPASGKTSLLMDYKSGPGGGLCLHEVSPDLGMVVSSCATKAQAQLSLVSTANGKVTEIPLLPDQGQSGGVLYSPSGKWLAYAVAKGEPDNESGKAAVLPSTGGTPAVLASFASGFAQIVDWVDEDRLLLERSQGESSGVWVIRRDGTGLTQLANGTYLGAIR